MLQRQLEGYTKYIPNLQILKVVIALGDYMNIKVHACVRGTAVRDDICTLSSRVYIVVGTPGRVGDMSNRRALKLENIQQFFS